MHLLIANSYGQTSAGKTYTMQARIHRFFSFHHSNFSFFGIHDFALCCFFVLQGDLSQPALCGVIPRAIDQLFASLALLSTPSTSSSSTSASAPGPKSKADDALPGTLQLSLSYLARFHLFNWEFGFIQPTAF